MTRELSFGRKGPSTGSATSLVIFLHGYGADGNDLLGLAEPLAPHLPGTAFIAPDAPEPCRASPFGRQWFPIPRLDGSTEAMAAAGLAAAAEDLQAFIDARIAEEGLSPSQVALVGFSQGTMMSLEVAPRRSEPLACVVGFSGRLIAPERLRGELRSRMPVLLIHGDSDEMVPFESMDAASAALSAEGFTVYNHVMRGMGHGIAPDGLSVAVSLLRERFGADSP